MGKAFEYNLLSGASSSCGCTKRKHGLYGTPTYTVWKGMKQRCLDPGHADYERYGGRGIKVCERWQKFENFLADMGERPSRSHSLDRQNNDKGYEPGNCRWTTNVTQQQNKRNTRMLTLFGETAPLVVWRDRFQLKTYTLWNWLKAGWAPERMEAELKKTIQ